jgi:ABC-2 type transport system ATP-binding protein
VLMSTHTLDAAEEISHRIGIMSHGKLLFEGTLDQLRQRFPGGRQSLEAMYLAMTEAAPQLQPATEST